MTRVEQQHAKIDAPAVLKSLLDEFSAVTDYRTLRDSLPRRMAVLLNCRCVLLYQRIGETLQFASGSFDEQPGWSSSLLAVAHINPIDTHSDTPEARAWRSRSTVTTPAGSANPVILAVPLIYRQHAIGVLVALRDDARNKYTSDDGGWPEGEIRVVEAVASIAAMLLENARLLERDRERIHELSLLNTISNQLHRSMYDLQHLRSIVVQRAREISSADLCELLLPSMPVEAISWITADLYEMLLQHTNGQRPISTSPLIIERLSDPHDMNEQSREVTGNSGIIRTPLAVAATALRSHLHSDYLSQLAGNIKTFFAIPLVAGRGSGRIGTGGTPNNQVVLGMLIGAFHRTWKLRHEEIVLLQVLASQAGVVLENMQLEAEVAEARSQARKLWRQVRDDQRLKELILENVPSGLITIDLRGYITTFNSAAEAILGYDPDEVLGKPVWKILDLHNLGPALLDEKEQSSTITTLDRHGREVVLDVARSPLLDDHGERIGVLITFSDVTSIHRLEEEKRRLDHLAALGEMAANVAHEVRNPLASIKTSMQMLLEDLAVDQSARSVQDNTSEWMNTGTPIQESATIVLQEIERLEAIVRDLLLFARPRQLHRVPCDLPQLSDRVLQLMRAQIEQAAIVVYRVYHPAPLLRVDEAEIEQVLLNLYLNAVQAMSDGGVLTITCQAISDWMELRISDTGTGIAPDELGRIFQPFFTTKAHGIGLGLPITRRLVEDHGGQILVESQPGCGTTITVRLPLNDD